MVHSLEINLIKTNVATIHFAYTLVRMHRGRNCRDRSMNDDADFRGNLCSTVAKIQVSKSHVDRHAVDICGNILSPE
jgi:hypothetical protein